MSKTQSSSIARNTRDSSKTSTWLYAYTCGGEFHDRSKVTKKLNEKINDSSISVYQLETIPEMEHQVCEAGSWGCYNVDASLITGFFSLRRCENRTKSFFSKWEQKGDSRRVRKANMSIFSPSPQFALKKHGRHLRLHLGPPAGHSKKFDSPSKVHADWLVRKPHLKCALKHNKFRPGNGRLHPSFINTTQKQKKITVIKKRSWYDLIGLFSADFSRRALSS